MQGEGTESRRGEGGTQEDDERCEDADAGLRGRDRDDMDRDAGEARLDDVGLEADVGLAFKLVVVSNPCCFGTGFRWLDLSLLNARSFSVARRVSSLSTRR